MYDTTPPIRLIKANEVARVELRSLDVLLRKVSGTCVRLSTKTARCDFAFTVGITGATGGAHPFGMCRAVVYVQKFSYALDATVKRVSPGYDPNRVCSLLG